MQLGDMHYILPMNANAYTNQCFHHVCILNTLQAIGYYVAFTVLNPSDAMPLVFVLTEKDLHLVLFPFTKEGKGSLVNALKIQIPLWTTDEGSSKECKLPWRLNLQLLHVLASLVLAQIFNIRLNVEYSFSDATAKVHLSERIITDKMKIDELKTKVEETIKEKDKEIKRVREEKDETIKEKDEEIKEKDEEIKRLREEKDEEKRPREEKDEEIKRVREEIKRLREALKHKEDKQ